MASGIGHINIVVDDLENSADFFVKNFGFTKGDPVLLDQEWVEKLTGFKNASATYVPLISPNGKGAANIELLKYTTPPSPPANAPDMLNDTGYRHIGIDVDDIEGMYQSLLDQGIEFFSPPVEVKMENPKMHLMTVYFYGPEGVIIQLSQALPPAS